MYLNTEIRVMNGDKPHKSKILQKLLNIECLCIHFLVCPGDQHGFWFTGGIFKEIFSS